MIGALTGLLVAAAGARGADRRDPEPLVGRAHVIDGDTLDLVTQGLAGARLIRLAGIDAFERDQPCRNGAELVPCGGAATAFLASLAETRLLACTWRAKDRYDRFLGTCYADGMNLNEAMVHAGWALAYSRYSLRYHRAEALARQTHAGAWAFDFIAPEAWRRLGPASMP